MTMDKMEKLESLGKGVLTSQSLVQYKVNGQNRRIFVTCYSWIVTIVSSLQKKKESKSDVTQIDQNI